MIQVSKTCFSSHFGYCFYEVFLKKKFFCSQVTKMESDEDLVQKLRNEFPEQFLSLVKMHLSFCLDQATDE